MILQPHIYGGRHLGKNNQDTLRGFSVISRNFSFRAYRTATFERFREIREKTASPSARLECHEKMSDFLRCKKSRGNAGRIEACEHSYTKRRPVVFAMQISVCFQKHLIYLLIFFCLYRKI